MVCYRDFKFSLGGEHCDYFDKLLSQIYLYQNDGSFFICGDFNLLIVGSVICLTIIVYDVDVDVIPERNVIQKLIHMVIYSLTY